MVCLYGRALMIDEIENVVDEGRIDGLGLTDFFQHLMLASFELPIGQGQKNQVSNDVTHGGVGQARENFLRLFRHSFKHHLITLSFDLFHDLHMLIFWEDLRNNLGPLIFPGMRESARLSELARDPNDFLLKFLVEGREEVPLLRELDLLKLS